MTNPPYFLFYVTPSGDPVDLDEEFESTHEARREAVLVARELISDRWRAGRASEFGCIQVRNEHGEVLANIFSEDALS